ITASEAILKARPEANQRRGALVSQALTIQAFPKEVGLLREHPCDASRLVTRRRVTAAVSSHLFATVPCQNLPPALTLKLIEIWNSCPWTGQSMRMVKRLYLLLPFLIMLILLCGQLPELLSFVDDTSNDFEKEPLAHVPESVKLATV